MRLEVAKLEPKDKFITLTEVDLKRVSNYLKNPATQDSFIQALDGAGVKFIASPAVEVPTQFDAKVLESVPNLPLSILTKKLKVLSDYLRLPSVIDNFGEDHELRRKWRKELIEKWGDAGAHILEENKLRANIFTVATSAIELLAYLYIKADKTDDPVGKELIALYGQIPPESKDYGNLNFADKMRVNAQLSNIVTKVLQLFAADTKKKAATSGM